MSLPALTTSGASYQAAWRAQDALFDGSNFITSIPSLVGGSGRTLTPEYWDGSNLIATPSLNNIYQPTGIDSGPAVESSGIGRCYTTDSGLLDVCTGSKLWQSFINGRWGFGQRFCSACGWEAWVANEAVYLENGNDGAPASLLQLDRGSSRRIQGAATYNSNVNTIMQTCDTDNDWEAYINGSGTADVTLSFDATLGPGVLSAYEIGPLQHTASGAFPPGIWTYSPNFWRWRRHVIVQTPSGFLNSTDVANLISWVEGTDFEAITNSFFFGMCP